jgi:pyridoxal phosphate enzyme (YggS family)
MTNVADNIAKVKKRIGVAATSAGRDPDEVTLVAITKSFPASVIAEAWDAGLRDFGENRVQEAESKVAWTRGVGIDLTWHMVGHLQRNKVKKAIELFDMVQSVDSVRLAQELSRRCGAAGTSMPILLEVNVSEEPSKYGFTASQRNDEQAVRFVKAVEQIIALPNLEPLGLMTVGPLGAGEEALRSCFARLRVLRERLREEFSLREWPHLSMGMTDDFELAITEGATIVRIGRAIFGDRRD